MPSSTKKQAAFFKVVEGAKRGQTGVSGKAKKVAKKMSNKKVKEFLKVKDESEEYPTVPLKKDTSKEHPTVPLKKDKPSGKSPLIKHRRVDMTTKEDEDGTVPMRMSDEERAKNVKTRRQPLKGKRVVSDSVDISKFVECIMLKNYASARKLLSNVIDKKIANQIDQQLNTPLFTK